MRYILGFKALIQESVEYDQPKGYCICEYITSKLVEQEIVVSSIENYRDMAWSADCKIDSKQLFFFVGYIGSKSTDWQLVICSTIGFIGRLFGCNDDNERLKIAKMIHSILSNDKRFSDLRWYSRYTDSPNDIWFHNPDSMR